MRLHHYPNFQANTGAAFRFYRSVFGGDFSTLIVMEIFLLKKG